MPPAPLRDEQTQVRIAIKSRYDHIDLIQVVVEDALTRLGLDADSLHWVSLAVREAVANAIKHGNRQDPDKDVEVELAVAGEEAVIRIHDRGEGFDPSKVPDPLAPENQMRANGRGIFYMKSFMDEIEFSASDGGGTVVTMRKRLDQPSDPAPDPTTSDEATADA